MEIEVDGMEHGGFAQILREVLEELGVRSKQIKYYCMGDRGPDNTLQGQITVTIHIPASETLPTIRSFAKFEVESMVAECIQSVSHSTLRRVARDARAYLEHGPYHLLPRAADRTEGPLSLVFATDLLPTSEENLCLEVMRRYALAQDCYIKELEARNRECRHVAYRADEVIMKMEQDKERLQKCIVAD